MDEIMVYYNDQGAYRVHAATCRDTARETGWANTYPAGSTLQSIAENEFSDFIEGDPDYYTPETIRHDFEKIAQVLPCAEPLISR